MSTEEALRWTIRDELPKRRFDPPLSALASGMNAIAVLGVRVDNWSREPGMPLAMGDPHPDALAVEQVLRELRTDDLDLSSYDIGRGLGSHCSTDRVVARQIERFSAKGALAALLTTHTIRNNRPDLGEGAMLEPAKGSRGQVTLWITEQEQIGQGADGTPWFTTTDRTTTPVRAGQYRPGTFCKIHWVRDADDIAEDRAVYAIWHAALVLLHLRLTEGTATDVDGNGSPIEIPLLHYLRVKPPASPATPWIEAPLPPAPRVLPGLTVIAVDAKPRVVAFVPRAQRHPSFRRAPLAA